MAPRIIIAINHGRASTYSYREVPGLLNASYTIYRDQQVIAVAYSEPFARLIVDALNSWTAFLSNMPIKFGRSKALN